MDHCSFLLTWIFLGLTPRIGKIQNDIKGAIFRSALLYATDFVLCTYLLPVHSGSVTCVTICVLART